MKRKLFFLLALGMLLTAAGCGAQPAARPETPSGAGETLPPEPETPPEDALTVEVTMGELPDPASKVVPEDAPPVSLTLLREEKNGVSSTVQWAEKNGLPLPPSGDGSLKRIEDAAYLYELTGSDIAIWEKSSGRLAYHVLLSENMGDVYSSWACLEDGVLYTTQSYNGYASDNTCYLLAMALDTGEVLWRSGDQTFNSHNFILLDSVILCGYGFTEEPDFLYQIDKTTGRVVGRTDGP